MKVRTISQGQVELEQVLVSPRGRSESRLIEVLEDDGIQIGSLLGQGEDKFALINVGPLPAFQLALHARSRRSVMRSN